MIFLSIEPLSNVHGIEEIIIMCTKVDVAYSSWQEMFFEFTVWVIEHKWESIQLMTIV